MVPNVYADVSTERVLTSEFVQGIPLDEISHLDQDTKNDVGSALLWLTMTELFDWRFMQVSISKAKRASIANGSTVAIVIVIFIS